MMIEINDLSFTYRHGESQQNLNHINLQIRQGETVLLCGESGCGKTTLTRLINGLIPHYYEGHCTGEIRLNGRPVRDYPLYQLAQQVASVFQNPRTQFYNVDTTSEVVFACENQGIPVEEITARLENTVRNFQLEPLMGRSLFALSGGEKQKIACASADVAHTDVIVLDEPSSNLDMAATTELSRAIGQWRHMKKTIIVAEHRLSYLMPLVDRVIYMKDGALEKEFSRTEFQQLTTAELQSLGLRSLHPLDIVLENSFRSRRRTLHIKNLSVSSNHKKGTALHIDDLSLPQREIIGIVGHNGSGKSTLARWICGLIPKARGTLEFSDVELSLPQRRQKTYLVMQDVNHQLFTESVMEELLLSMDDNSEQNRHRAKEILSGLGLLTKSELHPMALSGGEKQRVAIGSALASNRSILIFDEPTSGLDYHHMLRVSQDLKKLQQAGKTILLISHDPELINQCCSYLLCLKQGRLLWHHPRDASSLSLLRDFFTSNSNQLYPENTPHHQPNSKISGNKQERP